MHRKAGVALAFSLCISQGETLKEEKQCLVDAWPEKSEDRALKGIVGLLLERVYNRK